MSHRQPTIRQVVAAGILIGDPASPVLWILGPPRAPGRRQAGWSASQPGTCSLRTTCSYGCLAACLRDCKGASRVAKLSKWGSWETSCLSNTVFLLLLLLLRVTPQTPLGSFSCCAKYTLNTFGAPSHPATPAHSQLDRMICVVVDVGSPDMSDRTVTWVSRRPIRSNESQSGVALPPTIVYRRGGDHWTTPTGLPTFLRERSLLCYSTILH